MAHSLMLPTTWTLYQWHDVILFCIYATFLCVSLNVLRLTWKQIKIARVNNLHALDKLFTGLLTVNGLLCARTLLLLLTSSDYNYFQSTWLKFVFAHYGNLIMYVILYTAWLRFFYMLFRYLHIR